MTVVLQLEGTINVTEVKSRTQTNNNSVFFFFFKVKKTAEEIKEMKRRRDEARYTTHVLVVMSDF